MTFDEALVYLRDGKKVKRKAWSSAYLVFSSGKKLVLRDTNQPGRIFAVLNVTVESITSNDWEEVK